MSDPQSQTIVSSRATIPVSDLVLTLVKHGCPEVTSRLHAKSIGEFPKNTGGFGDVYLGQTTDGQNVAIKCARYRVQDDPQHFRDLTLMAREIHVWSKCNHENVLELFGLAQHRGQLAIVSPWMENGALPDYIGKNPDVDRLALCLQVTKGLAYLHQQNMIHGDLKGANVLVSSTGILKLADFGNTKLKEQTLQFSTRTTPVYSLRWAAPEILNGSPCSSSADIYALGMTILEIITGNVPYVDKAEMAVMTEVLVHGRFPTRDDSSIQTRGNKDWIWMIMKSCWNHDSTLRPHAIEVAAQTIVVSSGAALPIADLIATFVVHGCQDVTLALDTGSIGEFPIYGGGFGSIYSGQTMGGQRVAIKCVRYSAQTYQQCQDLKVVANELYAWLKCDHENVLELFGLAQYCDQFAIVSPWMEEGTLPEYITKNPGTDRLALCLQITKGLAYLHQQNIVHGDLKGVNIFVSSVGVLKLANCGNTSLKEQALQILNKTRFVHSLRWTAPEMLNGARPSPSADIYALGMTIYESVTGNVPYADKSDAAAIAEILTHRRFPARNDNAIRITGEKDWLWDLMRRCCDYKSAHRPKADEVETQFITLPPLTSIKCDATIHESKWYLTPQQYATSTKTCGIVLVGDGMCGKSCLIDAICTDTFSELKPMSPYVVNSFVDAHVGGSQIKLELFDFAEHLSSWTTRALLYAESRLIVMCFNIGNQDSLENIQECWASEALHTKLPFILVGCQEDLRDNPDVRTIEELRRTNGHSVTFEEGAAVAEKIGASFYLECSCKSGKGIQQIRDHVASMALFLMSSNAFKKKDRDSCIIC